ncbi:MAG: tetratricopeptide repeat protein [Microcoleus sp.]
MTKNDIALLALDLTLEECEEFSQEINDIFAGQEETIPRFIKTFVDLSNEYDDYLNPRLRNKLAEHFNRSEQDLEREALEFFQDELPNLRGGIDQANSKNEWLSVIDICDSLIIFFNVRTYWEELEETLKIALNASQKAQNKLAEARILNNLGHTFRLLGRAKDGINYSLQSVENFEELQNQRGKAEALYTLGYLYRSVGKWENSVKNFNECLSLFEDLEDLVGKAGALDGLGQVYTKQGSLNKAEEVLRESLVIKKEVGDRFQISITCNNLGKVCVQNGNLEEAENLFQESLTMKLEIGDRQGQGVCFNELGEVCRLKGEFEKALEYYQKSLKVKKQVAASESSAISDNHGEGLTWMNIGLLFRDKGEIEQAITHWKQASEKLNPYSPELAQVKLWLQSF